MKRRNLSSSIIKDGKAFSLRAVGKDNKGGGVFLCRRNWPRNTPRFSCFRVLKNQRLDPFIYFFVLFYFILFYFIYCILLYLRNKKKLEMEETERWIDQIKGDNARSKRERRRKGKNQETEKQIEELKRERYSLAAASFFPILELYSSLYLTL